MLAKFVVDSHFRSQPKGSEEMNMDGEDAPASLENLDPEVNFGMFFLPSSNLHVQGGLILKIVTDSSSRNSEKICHICETQCVP